MRFRHPHRAHLEQADVDAPARELVSRFAPGKSGSYYVDDHRNTRRQVYYGADAEGAALGAADGGGFILTSRFVYPIGTAKLSSGIRSLFTLVATVVETIGGRPVIIAPNFFACSGSIPGI